MGFLSPIIVQSEDTNTVCSGNATSDQKHQWTETIYSQLLYYLSAQTAVSLLLVLLSLVGKTCIKCESLKHTSIVVKTCNAPTKDLTLELVMSNNA